MYSVSIELLSRQGKDVSFTIPDFLKKYVEDAKCYDDYIFQYEKHQDYVSTYDTDRAKEYQITPEAYGVYFLYETPDGVKKHYKIDDFYEDAEWEYVDDYLEHLDIDENDVFDDPDAPGIVEKIKDIVNAERDEFLRWKQLKANYEKVMKQMRAGRVYDDEFLMSYYDPKTNDFKVPEPKYPCYRQGRPPVISCIFDDCMNSRLYTGRTLASLVISHRHQGQFPTGGAVGISLFFLIQSYKAQSGLPKCIRNQATSALIFRTKDNDELRKNIADSFSGEIDPEVFIELYQEATKDSPHDFLFVDLHHKKGIQPSGFRKNFDEYLIPPVN